MNDVLPSEADALYALPLSEFITARNALAKQLTREKRADEAAVVRSLVKPSIAAWAINQAARQRRSEMAHLLASADALRAAHAAALAGDRSRLRDATRRHRDAVDDVTNLAEQAVQAGGRALSESQRERVRATLTAASTDDAGRSQLEHGRLSRDLEPVGFGVPDVAAPSIESEDETVETADHERDREREREVKHAEGAVRDRRRAYDRAVSHAERLAAEARTAADRAADAQRQADAAIDAVNDARLAKEEAERRLAELSR